MLKKLIPFRHTGQLNNMVLDYLDQKPELKPFYNRFPKLDQFKDQIEEKAQHQINRAALCEVLKGQYEPFSLSKLTKRNIAALADTDTFTVTTGHQLNLASGPLYFIYKIISTINLAERLAVEFPSKHFVPIYWMATEDHDFAEINHFYFNSHKFFWDQPDEGKTGAIATKGLDEVWQQLNEFNNGAWHIDELITLFKEAYERPTLAEATIHLANELFGKYGLVVLDADCAQLKHSFIEAMKLDLIEHLPQKSIGQTNAELEKLSYKIQVNPREINLFYLSEQSRERIIRAGEQWSVVDSTKRWSRTELIEELEMHPERFSPNVTLRPLYQEMILPNLAYLGGGAEVSYWLELKGLFDQLEVPFPMVMLRNMVLVLNDQAQKKIEQLKLEPKDVFLPKHQLQADLVKNATDYTVDVSDEIQDLDRMNAALKQKVMQVDESLLPAVEAEITRRTKGLLKLEKKMIRVEKRKQKETMQRLDDLFAAVFPTGKVQERFENYSTMYAQWGRSFIEDVKEELDPLEFEMVLLGR